MILYHLNWDSEQSPLDIEFEMIRRGGRFKIDDVECGLGLFEHYRNAQKLLWPTDDEHRWAKLALETMVGNEVSVFMGCGDSGKTRSIAKFVLMDWWSNPEKTLWLVSSTELRGAELKIWGDLKGLFNKARELHPDLAGTVLESKHAITTEQISKDQSKGRLLTKGIIFIPCKSNGRWVGMGAFAGIKPQPDGRLGHAGDEVSAMERTFLDAYSNWYGKENFKGIMAGNPYDYLDPLCIAAEPIEGWSKWTDTEKTQQWRSKFYNAAVVAFDGRDSPNFDALTRSKYKYLIGPKKHAAVERFHQKDSWQYYSQCVGKPRASGFAKRVITPQLCEEFKAFDDVFWSGKPTIKVSACDAAYGGLGGDRCVTGHIEFGEDVEGNMILACSPQVIVPVSVKKTGLPEDQIADFNKEYNETFNIPPENFFFDGRSTLAMAFSRKWSPRVNAVDFGGKPTDRVVSLDTFVWDGDVQSRRLQRCDELYSKFVTELWFSVHYIILSGQMRRLPKEVAEEGYKREWRYVKGNRIELETKAEMKERTGQSPDLFDCLVTCVEGARRLGFQIRSMSTDAPDMNDNGWLTDALAKEQKEMQKLELNYK